MANVCLESKLRRKHRLSVNHQSPTHRALTSNYLRLLLRAHGTRTPKKLNFLIRYTENQGDTFLLVSGTIATMVAC